MTPAHAFFLIAAVLYLLGLFPLDGRVVIAGHLSAAVGLFFHAGTVGF